MMDDPRRATNGEQQNLERSVRLPRSPFTIHHPALLVIIAAACYFPFQRLPFVYDDLALIVNNPSIKFVGDPRRFVSPAYWMTVHPGTKGLYRPTREILFTLIYAAAGPSSHAFHVTSLVLHCACVLLVFLLARRVLGGRWPPLLAGLFFAVHPLHFETVAWAKNLGDLVCATFALLSAYLFVRADQATGTGEGRSWWRWVRTHVPACVALVLALATKETAVTVPLLMFIYVAFQPFDHAPIGSEPQSRRQGRRQGREPVERRRRGFRRALLRTLPLWLVVVVYLGGQAAFLSLGHARMFGVGRDIKVGVGLRFAMFAKTVSTYHRLMLFPVPLNVLHEFTHPLSLTEPGMPGHIAFFLVIVAATTVAAVRWRRGRLAVLWAALCLAPAYNLIPYAGRPIGENRIYWPSAGLCLLLGLVVGGLMDRRDRRTQRSGVGVAATLSILFLALLFARGGVWRSEGSFWGDVLRKSPGLPDGYHWFGKHYMLQNNAQRGIPFLEKAVKIQDWYPAYRISLGQAYVQMRRKEDARRVLEAGVKKNPRSGRLWAMLGEVRLWDGDVEGGTAATERAAKLMPGEPKVWYSLAAAYRKQGRSEDSESCLRKTLALSPKWVRGLTALGETLLERQRPSEAEQIFRRALAVKPDDCRALAGLGWALAAQGGLEEGATNFQRALDLSPKYVRALLGLGLVMSRMGRAEDAHRMYAEAGRLGSSHPGALAAYGIVLMEEGDYEAAAQVLAKAAKLSPRKVPALWRDLARCYERTGQLDRAVKAQERVVELTPNDTRAKARLEWLRSQSGHSGRPPNAAP